MPSANSQAHELLLFLQDQHTDPSHDGGETLHRVPATMADRPRTRSWKKANRGGIRWLN